MGREAYEWPPSAVVSANRRTLHLVAAHVLARRRYESSGRLGLRASRAGFATPAFGPEPEVVRVSGGSLVREVGGTSSWTRLAGSTLRSLAAFAGTDIDEPFSAGHDTPPVGDPDAVLDLDDEGASMVVGWFGIAWEVLDEVIAALPPEAEPATIQLWPEHFDAATTVTLGVAGKVNLGFSPGDSWADEPYVYVGPWGDHRPGPPSYWNAPFGAAFRPLLANEGLPLAAACENFLRDGISRLSREATT